MKKDKGFTLVELIVVLVILAILAALLIPALLGYIDKAREKQYLLKPGIADDNLIIPKKPGSNVNSNGDVNATETTFATQVLETIEKKDNVKGKNGKTGNNDPYLIVFGVGNNANDTAAATNTKHDKYTVYYMCYKQTESSPAVYYFNGAWSQESPRANGRTDLNKPQVNEIQVGALKGKRLQFYCISNKTNTKVGEKPFWTIVNEGHK